MELSLKQLNKMDVHKIFQFYINIIDKLFVSYTFLDLKREDYYELVLNLITVTKDKYTGDKKYALLLEESIKALLNNKIKQKLCNPETGLTVVNNYIETRKDALNRSDSISAIENIEKFFNKYNFSPSPDFLIELISKNDFINENIKKIVANYHDKIIDGQSETIFNSNLLLQLIDTWCMLNNIDAVDSSDTKEYSYSDLEVGDSFTMYMSEISNIPLLTQEETIKLMKRIESGDVSAKREFAESNLKLVVRCSKEFQGRGLQLIDLIQEGNIGLLRSIETYDYKRGFKFSTYAIPWIKQAIRQAIYDKARSIRIPVHQHEKLNSLYKAKTILETKLNQEPTCEELAKQMKVSVSQVAKLLNLPEDSTSLNAIVNPDDDTELESFVASSIETPEETYINQDLVKLVQDLLDKCSLKPKELEVLKMRFGFIDDKEYTLEEIGKKFGLSKERVRQLESNAIKKIRNSQHIKDLAIYMSFPNKVAENIDNFRAMYRCDKKNPYKTFLSNDGRSRVNRKSGMMTIYEQFYDYTREEINIMLSKLTEEEMALVKLRYGKNFDTPNEKLAWTDEQKKRFYGHVYYTIKKLLKKPETRTRNLSEVNINNQFDIKYKLALKTYIITYLANKIPVRDLTIVLLKLGYIVDSKLTPHEIETLFGTVPDNSIDIVKQSLEHYKKTQLDKSHQIQILSRKA